MWCNIARESWKRYETLPETKNVMERDAPIARDLKTLWKEMPRIARDGKHYVKRCHSLPEGSENMLENVGKT